MPYASSIKPGVVLRHSVKVSDVSSSSIIDGFVEKEGGDATMEFQATGGLFLLSSGVKVFHADHFFIPPDGDIANPRIDTIWVATGLNTEDGGGDPGVGAGYEMNQGTPAPSPIPAGALGGWTGYVLIAQVLVPAGATNANQCTITDLRNFV